MFGNKKTSSTKNTTQNTSPDKNIKWTEAELEYFENVKKAREEKNKLRGAKDEKYSELLFELIHLISDYLLKDPEHLSTKDFEKEFNEFFKEVEIVKKAKQRTEFN